VEVDARPRLFATSDGNGYPEEFIFEKERGWMESLIEGDIE